MRAIASKITGNSYPADIYNSMRDELENAVLSTDQTLDIEAGPDTDLNMLGKAAALYGGASDYYQDSGSVNTYILSHSTNLKSVPAYKDGLGVIFKASVANTGASTLNVSSLGAIALVDELGNALVGGEVSTSYYNIARYDNSSSKFQLVSRTRNSNVQNAVIDGGMIGNTGVAVDITGSYQYGQCPLISGKADGTPTNGSIEQIESALLGNTGFSSILKDITTGAGGIVYFRYRIESRDVRRFVDNAAIVYCKVYHDVGSVIDYTVTVNKPTVEDDFSSITNISTSSAISVGSTTEQQLFFIISDMGSCENGVEIIISADCGAITTKDFYLTELTFHSGSEIFPFQHKSMSEIESDVSRYYERIVTGNDDGAENTPFGSGFADSTTNVKIIVNYLPKRVYPVVTLSDVNDFLIANSGSGAAISAVAFSNESLNQAYLSLTVATVTTGQGVVLVNASFATPVPYIEINARL